MLLIGAFPTSPLALAVTFDDVDLIRALIAAGANVKLKDPDGLSLLHMAALSNRLEAAQELIKAGAPLNDTDKQGYTPLLYASTVDFGDDRLVNLLLRTGADAKTHAEAGETALSQARRYRYPYIQAALEKAGARE
jgi:ankyrin repeat protein